MNILQLINLGSIKLKANNIISHRIDSEILLSDVLNKKREELLINLREIVSINNAKKFQKNISRRSFKEPVAYILKKKEFWSKNFIVNRNVLIPRPETELMVEKIINIFSKKNIYILDVGTGTGCILLSILNELKNARGLGIDISSHAIETANQNLKKIKLSNSIKFQVKSLEDIYWRKFDLIVSNPPYIKTKDIKNLQDDIKKFEPKLALDGGNDGLDVIKKVIYKSKSILKIKGMLALEIGNEQFIKVSKILGKNNFRIRYLIKDFGENIRCILSTLER
ncbi:peptide chain release factor N(5)-glutamine methyltransferase [Candidatus Pelagibacter bacterium]|nr:peptide chain release factor N(5)-glutamine methyltransferase [Candidatus Pelagibacter bacterium]